jgi:hypothetical protein
MHGFGFLVDAELDSYQFDLLMVVSWAILQSKKKTLNEHQARKLSSNFPHKQKSMTLACLLKTRRSSQMTLLPLKKHARG